MNKRNQIFSLLTALFLVLALFCYGFYKVKANETINLKKENLSKTRLQTTDELLQYLQTSEKQFQSFIDSDETKKLLDNLESSFQKGIHSKDYEESKNSFSEHLAKQKKKQFFGRFILMSRLGIIIFSSDNDEVGFNIFNDALEDNELSLSLMRCLLTKTIDFSKFEFNAKKGEGESYFSFPLENGGVAACSIDIKPIYDIVLSNDLIQKDEEILLLEQRKNDIAMITTTLTNQSQSFQIIAPFNPMGENAIDKAMSGQEGIGKSQVFEKEVIASWNYIPYLNWGIVTFSRLNLLLLPFHYLIILAVIFFSVSLLLILVLALLHWKEPLKGQIAHPAKLLSGIIIISVAIACYQFYWLYSSQEKALHIAQKNIKDEYEEGLKLLQIPKDIVFSMNWMAEDLEKGKLDVKDLSIRLKRDFREIEALQKVILAFKPPPIDSYEATRKDEDVEISSLPFDYTDPSQFSYQEENWYMAAQSGKKQWLPVFQDRESNHLMAIYIAPFKGEYEGVVASYFDLFEFEEMIEKMAVGSSSRTFLMTKEGKVIGTHQKEAVLAATFFGGSEKKTKEFLKFKDRSGTSNYLYVEPILQTPWLVASLINENEIGIDPIDLRKHYFILISSGVAFFIAFVGLIALIFIKKERRFFFFSAFYVTIMAIGLITLWVTIQNTSTIPTINGLLVRDKNNLDNFINKIKKESEDKFLEAPIFLPTGISISFLEMMSEEKINFSGLVWQKYPEGSKIKKGVIFPQAYEFIEEEIFSKSMGGFETVNWRIKANLPLKRERSAFPFDNLLIKINMESVAEDPNVYLIPDLTSYHQYSPQNKPGIATNFTLPGYRLAQTFFSLENVPFTTNLGRDSKEIEKDQHALYFNIYLIRKLLIPFIPFLIPLIAIQVGMYAVFLMVKQEKGINFISTLSIYTGGFFAFAILQLSLRTRYAGENIVYAETFFFLGYFIICLLYVSTFLIKVSRKNGPLLRAKPYLNYFYWPFQITMWYIIAFIYFYS